MHKSFILLGIRVSVCTVLDQSAASQSPRVSVISMHSGQIFCTDTRLSVHFHTITELREKRWKLKKGQGQTGFLS